MTGALPGDALAALAAAPRGITGVVATVGVGGRPHTAPFGSLWAPAPDRLRFGCGRDHATFENLSRDPRVAVCIVTPPRTAVTVFGSARVLRQSMECAPSDAVVEIEIDVVKDDMLPGAGIDTGLTYSGTAELMGFVERYMTEIRQAEAN